MIALGRIERAVGLRGEMRLRLYNPDSRTLTSGMTVMLRAMGVEASESSRVVRIANARYVTGAVVVSLDGVGSRESAEALRGLEVCVAREVLPPLDDGEHYHIDFVGLEVRDASGTRIGEVLDVIPYPSVDALVVRMEDGKSVELPMVPDVVIDVSMSERTVTIDVESARELMEPASSDRRR